MIKTLKKSPKDFSTKNPEDAQMCPVWPVWQISCKCLKLYKAPTNPQWKTTFQVHIVKQVLQPTEKAHAQWALLPHTNDKPQKYKVCEKSFMQIRHVKTHMLTSTGKKPHKCGDCNKSYSNLKPESTHGHPLWGEASQMWQVQQILCYRKQPQEPSANLPKANVGKVRIMWQRQNKII